ncbi:MAG TPA: hypothetical protein VN699_04930, partial [Pirellulales bacterium]|nr:hypothetical protein [Pirellulales bacterium]
MNPRQNAASSTPNPQSPTANRQPPLGLETFQQPSPDQGLSLNELSQAFAGMMGAGQDPYAEPTPKDDDDEAAIVEAAGPAARLALASSGAKLAADEACEVSPRSIL